VRWHRFNSDQPPFDEPTRRHDDGRKEHEYQQQTSGEEGSTGRQEASAEVSEAGEEEVSRMAEKRTPERFRPLHVWRIRVGPKRSNKYWAVIIYPTVKEMGRWIESMPSEDGWAHRRRDRRPYVACCLTFKSGIPRNCLGIVVFNLNWIGSGIVVHEMTHAALRTLRLGLGKRLSRADEERLANTIEHLVKEFWRRWYRYAEPRLK
jgi:hypothetical protein